jgi:undecaprenyl phosphate N,N'-diacetylbacillosamine 1-phosphate transferase
VRLCLELGKVRTYEPPRTISPPTLGGAISAAGLNGGGRGCISNYILLLPQKRICILYPRVIKPLFDHLISFIALVIVSPIIVLIVVALAIANKGKVWFTQVRPGKNGKLFTVIKFKTMTDERDAEGNLLPDEKRLTAVGRFVRKTSIDEIPQLLNVFLGHMSFVGPRPLLTEYLPLYNKEQHRRHLVKPGITGWAQVNGRNTLGWQQKFEHDIWYVDHISFALDLKILFLTVIKVLKAEGISSESSLTMEKFRGNS